MTQYRNHKDRDVLLSPHYLKHVSAMTAEDLYSMGEIAEELAFRDIEIERLKASLKMITAAIGLGDDPIEQADVFLEIRDLQAELATQAEAIDLQLHTNHRIQELETQLKVAERERDSARHNEQLTHGANRGETE